MAKPTSIQELLPQAQRTLAHPTQPEPRHIEAATKWFTTGSEPWRLLGNESPEEKAALKKALDSAVEWLASWLSGLPPRWLVLVGPSGTGKTFLARRIYDYFSNWGASVYRRTAASKLSDDNPARIFCYIQERSAFAPWRDLVPHSTQNQERFAAACKDWFKVIDDLRPQTGAEVTIDGETGIQPKRFEATACGDLLDERLRKWTVITSNLTRKQLAIFWDVRIASRLLRGDPIVADFSDISDFGLRKENLE